MTAAMRVLAGYGPGTPGGALVDAGPVQGRLRPLVAAGWPQAELARRLGWRPCNFSALMRAERVIARTARTVDGLCDRMAGEDPPEGTARERAAVARTRRDAASRGWEPPPGCPRVGAGERRAAPAPRHRAADLVAEAEELTRFGLTRTEAAARLGVSRAVIDQAYSRFNRRQETNMTRKRQPGGPLRGYALAEECEELARYGMTRAQMAERTGATETAIDAAITRRNRKLAAAAVAAAKVVPIPKAAAPLEAGADRRGCGTILALLLHQALGEDPCRACAANAGGRGYPVRVPAGMGLAA